MEDVIIEVRLYSMLSYTEYLSHWKALFLHEL